MANVRSYRSFKLFFFEWTVSLIVPLVVMVFLGEGMQSIEVGSLLSVCYQAYVIVHIIEMMMWFYYKKNYHLNKKPKNVLFRAVKVLFLIAFLSLSLK